MAKSGNHGKIVPRNRDLLFDLYWEKGLSLTKIGKIYGVNHKSIEGVFRELGINRRSRLHVGASRCFCGLPSFKIRHLGNGSEYGRLCRAHWNEHRANLAKEYSKNPSVKSKKRTALQRWYYCGAINPTGELEWLNRNKIMLRNVRRLLLQPKTKNLAALRFLKRASVLERSLEI